MSGTLTDVPTEKAITKGIRDLLTSLRLVFYKQHGSAYSLPGTPDFLLAYRGHFVGIEVKRPHSGSRLRPEQKRELDRINDSGGFAIVARDKQDVLRLFRHIDGLHEHVAGTAELQKGY